MEPEVAEAEPVFTRCAVVGCARIHRLEDLPLVSAAELGPVARRREARRRFGATAERQGNRLLRGKSSSVLVLRSKGIAGSRRGWDHAPSRAGPEAAGAGGQ